MTDEFTNVNKWAAGSKLVSNESVTKVVNLDVLDTGYFEVAVKAGTNIADKERVTCFGDEDMRRFGFGSIFKITLYTVFNGLA